MNQINIQDYKTKIGELTLGSFDERLCLLSFRYGKKSNAVFNRIKRGLKAEFVKRDDGILKETRREIDEYLAGNRKRFEIPLLMVGTNFQKSVWNALLKLPCGSRSTYLQLSKKIQHAKAVRAVAGAIGANPIVLLIPCHRIIGSDGKLVGYRGGLALKKRLLELEQIETAH